MNRYESDGYVYVRENGTRYKTSWLSSTFKKFLKQNGLRQIRFHNLRHTCATMLSDYLTGKTDDDEYGNVVRKKKEADKG